MTSPEVKQKENGGLSLLARQTVFTQSEAVSEGLSTLLTADASVFHPMPEREAIAEGEAPDAYATGFNAGQAQAELVFKDTIAMMEGVLSGLKSDLLSMSEQIEASHSRTVIDCLRAIMPDIAQRTLMSEIARVIQDASSEAFEGHLEAKIHPENVGLSTFFQSQANTDIRVVTDPNLSETGVSFLWSGGGVDIDPIKVATVCLSLLDPAKPRQMREDQS